jgi:hypothetical protein
VVIILLLLIYIYIYIQSDSVDENVCCLCRVDCAYVGLNLFCMAVAMEVILHVCFRVENWSDISYSHVGVYAVVC